MVATVAPVVVLALVLVGALRCCGAASRRASSACSRPPPSRARAMVAGAPGLQVFRSPKLGAWAASMQLTAWAIQWLACYVLLVALGLDDQAGVGAAAAVLFAVNVTAALPATPSNLGVFQAACVAVLSAYGVGKTNALAYGMILQAVEIATALAHGHARAAPRGHDVARPAPAGRCTPRRWSSGRAAAARRTLPKLEA